MQTTPSSKDVTLARVREAGILAVVRAASARQAVEISRALLAGGVLGLEITYTTPGATEAIAELHSAAMAGTLPAPPVLGAGTVLNVEQAQAAISAGASFLVSPCVLPEVIQTAREASIIMMPGAFTPTEIYQAYHLGGDIIKVFPAARLGPAYFKDLRGPFPNIPLMPTGGVDAANAAEWLAAGAFALGAGGNLLPKSAVEAEDWPAITALARELVEAVTRFKNALHKT
jgi:2-dehydro-3-deoxyphosphogluconate aldolase/(4S)-4-hydroxy-2-oxoglutarate aldolase